MSHPPPPTRSTFCDTQSLPFQLRANDITKHIINIDSRFRDSPASSTPADFYYTLLAPVRNILRIRVTSIEFPNNYHVFTVNRRNTTLQFIYNIASPQAINIEIPDGNYTAGDMVDTLTTALTDASLNWLTVAFDETTGAFTFAADRYFALNAAGAPGTTWDRPFDYGLGFNLGFTRKVHLAKKLTPSSTTYALTSDTCATFQGDNYVFLRVNDYGCVKQTVTIYDSTGYTREEANDFTALAKVVLREPKNYMAFDDYASQHAKEFVFTAPTDLQRLHIQVLDIYGHVMDLCSSPFSFSIEVLEVKNSTLYNAVRDSLAACYT